MKRADEGGTESADCLGAESRQEKKLTMSAHVDHPKTDALVGRELDLQRRLLRASGIGSSRSRAVVDAVTVDETGFGRRSSDALRERNRVSKRSKEERREEEDSLRQSLAENEARRR